ncbi:hypothetical protein NDU88_004290 [Pleurodeles waltl]|uniref:Uncharacterized protein n=1 Tax=Pleurodeles waltl TaxID=8319 RepID=A0AAV7LJC9_PLEWA|nr:hypothetical protein NDU88_004290 [Pleurodeles waltl]
MGGVRLRPRKAPHSPNYTAAAAPAGRKTEEELLNTRGARTPTKKQKEKVTGTTSAAALDMRNEETVKRNISWFKQYHCDEKAPEEKSLTENIMEEPEEDLITDLHGEICPPVGTQCSSEARKGAETAGTGEVNQEAGVREADKLPEIVVPDVTLKRGGDRYNLRSRITTPMRLKDYVCS